MKVIAAGLLAIVFTGSTLFTCSVLFTCSAMAADSKKEKSAKASTKECSAADKKAGKCGHKSKEKAVNVSATTAAPNSVRKASIDSSASRMPASVREANTH